MDKMTWSHNIKRFLFFLVFFQTSTRTYWNSKNTLPKGKKLRTVERRGFRNKTILQGKKCLKFDSKDERKNEKNEKIKNQFCFFIQNQISLMWMIHSFTLTKGIPFYRLNFTLFWKAYLPKPFLRSDKFWIKEGKLFLRKLYLPDQAMIKSLYQYLLIWILERKIESWKRLTHCKTEKLYNTIIF
jgi:hypothetical protein